MYRRMLFASIFLMVGMISCKSLRREERDLPTVPQVVQMAAANRQIGGGISALGTLVSPLLFLMGIGSFFSMLPQMYSTIMSSVGSNLLQTVFNNAPATGSSSRLKRSADVQPLLTDDLLDEIERRLNLAVMKNERPIN